MSNKTYPKKIESLLKKAGLIGIGTFEVRSVRVKKTVRVAEAYEGSTAFDFEKKEVALDNDRQMGGTCPVLNNNGQIAGYWANGLSKAEREAIHNDAGVPYFYLRDKEEPDTYFHLFHGKVYDLTVPAQMAEVKCLLRTTFIGHNKQDALDYDADFYFYSKKEERANKKKRNNSRKKAVDLISSLNVSEKREVLRVMYYQGSASVDPFLSEVDAELIFDDYAYEKPISTLRAYEMSNKYEFIAIHALKDAGWIESDGKDGPYYKSPQYFGSRIELADNLDKCIKAIRGSHRLMAAFREMEKDNSHDSEAGEKATSDSIYSILEDHLVTDDEDVKENPLVDYISKSNRTTIFKMLEDNGDAHAFDSETDIEEIRKFAIEKLANDK